MKKKLLLLVQITIFSVGILRATTWDEPWADKVIREATSFVLAKVISCDPEKGITIHVIKILSGKELKDNLVISDFYLLDICSSSGHGAEFHTEKIDSCYFFIKENGEGKYCIATPTTGFDYASGGQVMATFRHSYHQASVPVSVYEKTMVAVFNNYHSLEYDKDYITSFVNEYLNKVPAGFSENEINTFFLQHVALECVYHLKLSIAENLVIPFLNDRENFHNQVSAARAMVAFNTNTSKKILLNVIGDTTYRSFVKVICIWTLREFKPKELKSNLSMLEKKASVENDNFGGNIMDPRVCTRIPSVKDALTKLIQEL